MLEKNMKRRDRRRRNAIAKDLRSPKYKQRRIEKKDVEETIDEYCPDCGCWYPCDCTRMVRQGLLREQRLCTSTEGGQGDSNDDPWDSETRQPDKETSERKP